MHLEASYVQAFPWESNQRVNFYMTHFGHGPGEIVRGFAVESRMPCRTLDLSAVMEDQTGYACEAFPRKHHEDKPERTDADRAAEAEYRREKRLEKMLLAAGGSRLWFVTLTFRDEPADQAEASKAIQAFLRRMRVRYKKPPKMLWVYERGGEGGRLHIHAVIIARFLHKQEVQEELWRVGFVNIEGMAPPGRSRSSKAIARYVSKYMRKGGKTEGLTRQGLHVTKAWPDTVTKSIGLAEDPLNTARDLAQRAKQAGCPVACWDGELEDGTKYVSFEIGVKGGARFLPDIRVPVPLLLLRRAHLAQARRKESEIFYNHIEARRLGARVVYMSTANLSYREGFSPGQYVQWAKEL